MEKFQIIPEISVVKNNLSAELQVKFPSYNLINVRIVAPDDNQNEYSVTANLYNSKFAEYYDVTAICDQDGNVSHVNAKRNDARSDWY